MGEIVGVELVKRDRESFDQWWPEHLTSLNELVDRLYLRADASTYEPITALLAQHPIAAKTELATQYQHYGRFQEDAERQALLASAAGAEWVACFDADEVIEPGGGAALRAYLLSRPAQRTRLVRVILSYASHHRPGWILPRGAIKPFRAFRLDKRTSGYRYRSDADGLHCGSVPAPGVGAVTCPDLRVIHYHATTCEEYMDERRFYDQTVEVHKHGGIDYLYRCDRFGDEADAVPMEQELSGADERLARVAAGRGMTR